MVVSAGWPGATLVDTMNELTNTIAEKLEETPYLDYLKSYTEPGQTVIYVNLLEFDAAVDDPRRPGTRSARRSRTSPRTCRQGTQGPFFNDEYGDVYGIVFGVTFDGFTWRQARDFAETAKAAFLSVARHRQGRDLRRPGREDLSELLAGAACRAQHQPQPDHGGARRAERRDSGRRHHHAERRRS